MPRKGCLRKRKPVALWRELRPVIERMATDHIKSGDKGEGTYALPGVTVVVRKEAF